MSEQIASLEWIGLHSTAPCVFPNHLEGGSRVFDGARGEEEEVSLSSFVFERDHLPPLARGSVIPAANLLDYLCSRTGGGKVVFMQIRMSYSDGWSPECLEAGAGKQWKPSE